MWKIANDMDNINHDEKMESLKFDLFDKLVFFLSRKDIISLTKIIEGDLRRAKLPDDYIVPICKITAILQTSIIKKDDNTLPPTWSDLEILCKSFINAETTAINLMPTETENRKNITFWHFNMLDDTQLKVFKEFKEEDWLLSLIEYNEDWRTNSLKQVQENDVIFLFRRGGYGYIGAFRAKETKVFTDADWKKICDENKYEENAHFDMYDAFADGATLVANICVEPIAYNYNGVGCLTVRRRTIERMNDMEAVKFLLNRFSGKVKNDQDPDKLGMGKLDENTDVELNSDYFNSITKNYLK